MLFVGIACTEPDFLKSLTNPLMDLHDYLNVLNQELNGRTYTYTLTLKVGILDGKTVVQTIDAGDLLAYPHSIEVTFYGA